MRYFNTILSGILLTCAAFAQEVELFRGWTDNLEAAKKEAKGRQCFLLIAFLGPNWCEYSDKLEEEVLSQKAFKNLLKRKFVFVRVDIPENLEEKNCSEKELRKKYNVEECPCIVLATSEGEIIAKLDYLPITCSHFASYIRQICNDYNQLNQLSKLELRQMKVDEIKHFYTCAGRLADTACKKILLNQGLKVDRGPYFLVEKYGNLLASGTVSSRTLNRLRNRIVARDPQNKQGYQRKLALIDFELREGKKTSNQVIQPLVRYLSEFGSKDLENAWKLEMKISQYLFSRNQVEEALKHAQLSLEVAPKKAQKDIVKSIEYLQKVTENSHRNRS